MKNCNTCGGTILESAINIKETWFCSDDCMKRYAISYHIDEEFQVEYKRRINNEAVRCFEDHGFHYEEAQEIVKAIILKKIKYVEIKY